MQTTKPTAAIIQAWTSLVRTGQGVLAAVEYDLKKAGFPPLAWYDVLLELRREEPAGLRPIELEKRVLLAQYNVSRITDRLERAGHLLKRPCPEDKRGSFLHITSQGCALLKQMWPVYAEAIQRRVGQQLSDADAKHLTSLLNRLDAQ